MSCPIDKSRQSYVETKTLGGQGFQVFHITKRVMGTHATSLEGWSSTIELHPHVYPKVTLDSAHIPITSVRS